VTDVLKHFLDAAIAVIIIFLAPLIYFGQKQDAFIQTLVSVETGALVSDIRSSGYLTRDMYDDFLDDLSRTGLLYDIKIEHRQQVQEPEYRFRTAEEVIEQQNAAYSGSNYYTYRSVTTDIPAVSDPVNTGTLNTETNASVLASAVNTPASSSHIHTAACYVGHYHTGTPESGGGCYTIPVYHTHISACYTNVSIVHYHASGCYLSKTEACGGTINYYYSKTMMHGGTIQDKVDIYYGVCSACGATGNKYVTFYKNVCKTGTHPTEGGTTTCDNIVNKTVLICNKIEGNSYTESYITCNKTLGVSIDKYNLGCGLSADATLDCGQIITSIAPTHPVQTVAIGDSLITTVTVTFLDGSTKVVAGTTAFSTANPVQNSTAAIHYSYTIDGSTYLKTCNITITVVPRSKTCMNGHTYNLNSDGSDPGCPYCRSWLASLKITFPATSSITIYKGSTLPENGVILMATYMDGHTQYLYNEYVDNLDNQYIGSQNVTISYKGKYVSLTAITKRNLKQCPICLRYYELYPDGSDPGCPYETARIPIFTGTVMKYNNESYTNDIIDTLYEGDGIYYFNDKDYIMIDLKNESKSWGYRLLSFIFKGLGKSNIQTVKDGYIREDGSPD